MLLDSEVPVIRSEAARLASLGARAVGEVPRGEHGNTRILMTDTEGKEFCFCVNGCHARTADAVGSNPGRWIEV